ncbi:hypothetical protein [Vibrio parahaemolyticus]|uniref:hypothetical protein n=1 Tax=Vibrio parahaemolyticus TaxID=670 RepID=UPI0004152A64|nr:hypothetical protein [Vibrio parahaemolyticus]
MEQISKRTIVHNKNRLLFLNIEESDHVLLQTLSPLIEQLNDGKSSIVFYAKLMHVYSDVFDDRLSQTSIKLGHVTDFLGRFLKSIKDGILVDVSPATFNGYLYLSRKCLIFLSLKFGIGDYHKKKRLTDIYIPFDAVDLPTIDCDKADYYSWWVVKSKSGKKRFLDLTYIWKNEGADAARQLEKYVNSVLGGFQALENHLPLFSAYFLYLSSVEDLNYFDLKSNSDVSDSIWRGFCAHFFTNKVESGNCLMTTKKRWNDGSPALFYTLFETGFFARPNIDITYIPTEYKTGTEVKIKKIKDAPTGEIIQVKEKLLTDVPIYLTDDEAIESIFDDIEDDYNIVVNWAKKQLDDLWIRYSDNNHQFNFDDLDLSNDEFRIKYRLNCYERKVDSNGSIRRVYGNKTSLAESFGMPTSYFEIPISILLIKEHNDITDSFLYNLDLYDKNGHRVGFYKLDNNYYLQGYKLRKSGRKAEQTIKLNAFSKEIIEKLLAITSRAREYLKKKGDDNYRKLFINTGQAFSHPRRCFSSSTSLSEKYIKYRFEQLKSAHADKSEERLNNLNKNLTLTRFRASCAVMGYLKDKDVSLMAKNLGHDKYRQDLLSHYLPEPILQYFQSRWIRIFQKGIICEAMKDNKNLLKASSFNNINELERFLFNHALKIKQSDSEDVAGNDANGKVLVGINIEVLKVLLAIKNGTIEDDKLSIKDSYYLSLSELIVEDIRNSDDVILKSYLEKAEKEMES